MSRTLLYVIAIPLVLIVAAVILVPLLLDKDKILELAAANPAQRYGSALHARLADWIERRYRDRLAPADLADPQLVTETRETLDELTRILHLGSDFYPFQRG